MGWFINQDPFADRKEQGGDEGNRRGRPLGSKDKQPRRRPKTDKTKGTDEPQG